MRAALQQRRSLHDHTVDTITALHGLFVNQSALQRVRPSGSSEPFQRDNLIPFADLRERQQARPRWLAVDVDGAGAALPKTAAEFRSLKAEIIAQNVQERGGPVNRRHRDDLTIQPQIHSNHRRRLSTRSIPTARVNCEARISLSAAIKYTSNRSRGRPINSPMGKANNEQSLCYPAARGFIRVRLVPRSNSSRMAELVNPVSVSWPGHVCRII